MFEMKKGVLIHSLVKPRQYDKEILKTHEQFIYGDICYIINSCYKNVLIITT